MVVVVMVVAVVVVLTVVMVYLFNSMCLSHDSRLNYVHAAKQS